VIRTAAAIAESALYHAAMAIEPGCTEKHVQAAFIDRMCSLGTSQFAQQGTFTVIDPHAPLRWITSERRLQEGDAVALGGGVLWAGYEASLARTWSCGDRPPSRDQRAAHEQGRAVLDAVVAACCAGATGADLVRAHEAAGAPVPPMPIVYGIGLGHEGAIAGSSRGAAADAREVLQPGMVLGVRTFVQAAVGGAGYFGEDMVLVQDHGPELLTALGAPPGL
jgi:Xaa-Pro aminopeptidase